MATIYDLDEKDKLIERQRQALDELLKAVGKFINKPAYTVMDLRDLIDEYKRISSLSTMTGSSEQ